jgi:hypothetical protein
LNAARQALAADGNDQVSRAVREARQRVRSLVHRQDQVIERLQLGEETGVSSSPDADNDGSSAPTAQSDARPGGNGRRSIDELKAGMQVDAQQLREQLDRIASAVGTEAQVRAPARRAGEVMREEDVEGRLRHSRQQLAAGESYGSLESSISQALRRVQEQIEEAAAATDAQRTDDSAASRSRQAGAGNSAGASDGERVASARPGGQSAGRRGAGARGGGNSAANVERLREMMRGLAGLRERMGPGGGGSAAEAGPGGRPLHDLRALASDLSQLPGVIGSASSAAVASNYDPAGDLQALLEGIETLASETTVDGTQVSDALLAALERVERFVKDSVEADQTVVPTGRDARTPPQYRTLVEAYYRRLSEVGERPDTER